MFSLWFKSYKSCSILGTFSILIVPSRKPLINTHHKTQNLISDSVKWKFLKFANVNFSNRIFFKIRGRNEILNKKFGYSIQFGVEFRRILEYFLWLEVIFLTTLTKTCRLGSWLLKVFLWLIFVSSQSVMTIKIKPVN